MALESRPVRSRVARTPSHHALRRLTRSRLAQALTALTAVLWVATLTLTPLHVLLVPHGRCAEHGELVELDAASVDRSAEAGPSAAALNPSHHDDVCSLTEAAPGTVPHAHLTSPALHVATLVPTVFWPTAAPRGPPLAYATKTSPPHPSA